MSSEVPRVLVVKCIKCGEMFYPFGKRKQIYPPVIAIHKCPNCGHESEIIWDQEIEREVARKTLGLEHKNERIKQLQSENQELKEKIAVLEKQFSSISDFMRKHKPTLDELARFIEERRRFLNEHK